MFFKKKSIPSKIDSTNPYQLSQFLRDGCHKCPFCGCYGFEKKPIDETQTARLRQSLKCYDCGKEWIVEYDAARLFYKGKRIGRYEYWKKGE